MQLALTVQNATGRTGLPSRAVITRWAQAALAGGGRGKAEVTVRLVGAAESARLNKQFRAKSGPTNVLSFSYETPAGLAGDLVLCVPVVEREARSQNKPRRAHWAHLVVHGILHLRGFDHVHDAGAQAMEALEVRVLRRLGLSDPYA